MKVLVIKLLTYCYYVALGSQDALKWTGSFPCLHCAHCEKTKESKECSECEAVFSNYQRREDLN